MTHVPLTRICFIHSWWKKPKKSCLKASMFFYFYPVCFPTFCHLNPISGWLNHVKLQRLMVFTSILQAFMLVSQPPKSECWLMSIHLNQFQSIYIYKYIYIHMCVCVFQVKNLQKHLKNTTILPAVFPCFPGLGQLLGYGQLARPLTPSDPCCLAPEVAGSMGKMWWDPCFFNG